MALVPRNSKIVPNYVRNNISGLGTSNNVGDVNNDINIAAGSCSDSSNVVQITLSSVIIKRLDANWVAGTNQGGLDTGAKAAGTTYHIHVIYNPSTAVTDVLYSTSAISPVLPSGYLYFRRVASIVTDGSANIRQYVQNEDSFDYNPGNITCFASDGGALNSDFSLTACPTGINVEIHGILIGLTGTSNVAQGWANVYPPGVSGTGASQVNVGVALYQFPAMSQGCHVSGAGSNQGDYAGTQYKILAKNGQVRIQAGGSGTISVRMSINGWIDTRGKTA